MDPDNPFSNDWNSMELRPPNMEFFRSTSEIVTCVLKAVMNEHRENKSRQLLFIEMTLLSKFLAQRKYKYRSDKGFTSIAKIEKAVNRIHQLDLKTATTLLKANLFCNFAPSKQVGQWFLIKLLSNSLLLNRTIECCKYSVFMLNHRLRTGHSWGEITLTMAMISRIWSLATHLIKKCFFSYQKLFEILDDLASNPTDTSWIFTNYKFPSNLEEWISQPHDIPSSVHNGERILQTIDIQSSSSKHKEHYTNALKQIRKIKSAKCLKFFILEERKLRRLKRDCVSKNLSTVQWKEVDKKLLGSYKLLKASNDNVTLMKRIRKKIKKWLLNI